jgi:hypothetical protein
MSQADKVVRITLNDQGFPVPDQDPVEVKQNAQHVRFCAEFDFSIVINGYTNVTKERGNGNCAFAVKTGTFGDAGRYKYDITANGNTTDPILDVKPDEEPPPPPSAG